MDRFAGGFYRRGMAQNGNPQSIGSERLQDAGNPDKRRRDDAAERDFAEAAQPDKADRKADVNRPDDPDAGKTEGRPDARERDASTGR
jgi:hypothetical protein